MGVFLRIVDSPLALRMGASRALLAMLVRSGEPTARILGEQPPEDPYPVYEQIRARGELSTSKLKVFFTASHSLTTALLKHPAMGVVPGAVTSATDWNVHPGDAEYLVHPVEQSLLMIDPPQHTRLRRLVSPWFTPRALEDFRPRVEEVVSRTLDDIGNRSEFDLVSEFAVPVVVRVLCELFDLADTELDRFARWGGTLARGIGGIRSIKERDSIRATLAEMTPFFEQVIAHRRGNLGDDIVSGLLKVRLDGEPLVRRDLLGLTGLLLGAGFETTVNLIGNAALALLDHPASARALVETPSLAPAVVEETLRYDSPVQYTARRAREGVTLAGTELPAGTIVIGLIGAANRDPAVFAEPGVFDISRPNSRENLSFSSGIHYCLAAGLARIEAEAAVRQLFTRHPGLRLAGPVSRQPKRNIRGAANLPLAVGASSVVGRA